eukprot:Gb_19427 [translate_table: standard]
MAWTSRLLRFVSSSKSLSCVRIPSNALQVRPYSSSKNGPCVVPAERKYVFASVRDRVQSTEWTWLHALPFAMAAFAGAVALNFEPQTSVCEASQTPRVGGSGSTELVVKGNQRSLPEAFLNELRAVCGAVIYNIHLDFLHICNEYTFSPNRRFFSLVRLLALWSVEIARRLVITEYGPVRTLPKAVRDRRNNPNSMRRRATQRLSAICH